MDRSVAGFLNETEFSQFRKLPVKADLDELETLMNKDKEIKTLLMMTGEEIENSPNRKIRKYIYPIKELVITYKEMTLLNIIENSIEYEKSRGTRDFFLKDQNGELYGFIGYIIKDNGIDEVKMFSFKPENYNEFLQVELNNFLSENLSKYNIIIWNSLKANPANVYYKRVMIKYNGTRNDNKAPNEWRYTFVGKPNE